MKWVWIILAILYLVSPYDIIPGLHPAGWIDDIFVLVLLYRYLVRLRPTNTAGRPTHGDAHSRQRSQDGTADTKTRPVRSPYEVLGIAPGANQDEIHAAYRKLVNRYHPDKVSHLGEEFQTLAEERFKEIQEAYDRLSQ
ncbi:MAG: DnaJ domain-containing protein [Desulfobacteraceae bacterium]